MACSERCLLGFHLIPRRPWGRWHHIRAWRHLYQIETFSQAVAGIAVSVALRGAQTDLAQEYREHLRFRVDPDRVATARRLHLQRPHRRPVRDRHVRRLCRHRRLHRECDHRRHLQGVSLHVLRVHPSRHPRFYLPEALLIGCDRHQFRATFTVHSGHFRGDFTRYSAMKQHHFGL